MIYRWVLLKTVVCLCLVAPLPLHGQNAKSCSARIAIAPAPAADTILGDGIADRIGKELRARSNLICTKTQIIPQDESRPIFDYIGSTSFFSIIPRKLKYHQVEFVEERLGATHIAFVAFNKKKDLIQVDVRHINIEDDHSINEQVLKFYLPMSDVLKDLRRTPAWLNFLALLTPNTATVGFVNTEVSLRYQEAYEEQSVEVAHHLPQIVSSIGFNKIEHPRSYRMFDYGGSLFPTTFLFAIDQVSTAKKIPTLTEPNPTEEFKSKVELYGACAIFQAQGSIHTPLGTTYTGLGAGPCIYQNRQDDSQPVTYGVVGTRFNFGHRAFFTDRWYFVFEADSLTFGGKPIYKSNIAHANSLTRGTFAVGYYLPDVEHLYTDFWSMLLK